MLAMGCGVVLSGKRCRSREVVDTFMDIMEGGKDRVVEQVGEVSPEGAMEMERGDGKVVKEVHCIRKIEE